MTDPSADHLELLAYLLAEENSPPPEIPGLTQYNTIPLSFAQQRLWFLDQLENHGPAYNIPVAYRLAGPLNEAALRRSLSELLRRHTALRTTFTVLNGEPVQTVAPAGPVDLPLISLAHLPPASRAAEAAERCAAAAQRPFNLARDPLLRASLFQLTPTEHILLLVVHHIAADGWSVRLLLRELASLYAAFAAGQPSPLPEPLRQYPDFAAWQQQVLTPELLAGDLAYWRTQLADSPPLALPTDFPHPAAQTFAGDSHFDTIPPALTQSLKQLARHQNATPFMVLLAAFYALLYRLSGQTDLLIGTPIANRDRAELEQVVGFFANTLVLRTRLAGELPFRWLVGQVKETTLEALAHQQLPFERLVETLQPERSLSRNPLFQVMFSYWDDSTSGLALPGLSVEEVPVRRGTAKFELHLAVVDTGDSLQLELEYNTDLFRPNSAARLLRHFQTLLAELLAHPDQPVAHLPLLTPAERDTLLVDWNATAAPPPTATAIHQLFEAQAQRTPAAIAVESDSESLTYTELDRLANRLANHLLRLGLQPGEPVGLCLDSSPELAVALLAVLKAGGACLPLDPGYPPARLQFMLADAAPPLLLASPQFKSRFADFSGRLLTPADIPPATGSQPPPLRSGPAHPLYIMYTSGSTGQPKGVVLPQRALLNLLQWQQGQLNPAGRRTLQFTPLSFDVSFQEIFSTWQAGGTLVLLPAAERRNPEALLNVIARRRIERLFLPFVALQALAEAAAIAPELPLALTEVITAGEQLQITPAIVRLFGRLPGAALHNHYGPTETHVVTAHTLTGPPELWPSLPPIGRPIANTQIYVLDECGQPAPIGIPGELHIGGAGLAHGYHNRPELTAEKFIPNPFIKDEGGRQKDEGERWKAEEKRADFSPQPSSFILHPSPLILYKTGDLARFRADGTLEFLGRADRQLKIRGFRVEPGEVEATLRRHPAVKAAVVAAVESTAGERQLVAYIVPYRAAPALSEIREFLAPLLPDYMLPAAVVTVEHFPLTPSGKLDVGALPRPQHQPGQSAATFDPPQTAAEQTLAQIWANLLGLERVSRSDNFFELGGHSLLAVRLFAAIEAHFGSKPPLAVLFEQPTLAGLASVIARKSASASWQPLVLIKPGDRRPPLFLVHGFGGGVVDYGRLAHLLTDARPVYGLVARGVDDPGPPHTGVEEMAAAYVQAIRGVQPGGPYFVGGYCFGGVVAYEVARQLHTQHEPVALLAILEGYAPLSMTNNGWPAKLVNMARNLPYWLSDYLRLGFRPMLRRATRRARLTGKNLLGRGQQLNLTDVLDETGHIPHHRRPLMETHLRAMLRYTPPPYPGRVTLFRVRGLSLLNSHDPQLGWGRLAAGGVNTRLIGGSHGTILQEPHLRSLAAALDDSLRQADALARPGN